MALLRPPGPPDRGFVGNFPMGSKDPLGLLRNWAAEYGDIFHYRVLWRHIYFLNHPDLVKDVLLTKYQHFIKGEALRFNRRIFGNGLLTNEGESWLQQRRLIQPAFHRDRVEAYAAGMVAHTARQIAAWEEGETRDLYGEMMRLTLQMVGEALFRIDILPERDRFAAALNTVLELSAGARMLMPPLLRLVPTRGNMRYLRAVRQLDAVVYGLIRQRRAEAAGGEDLLSELLRAKDANGLPMPDKQLRDEVMTLLLAGHETTAVTLTWTWYLLSQHPEVEAKLWDELRRVLDGRDPTLQDLAGLPYTARVVKEAMRLYPPVWALVRSAKEECEIGGYRVPTGSTILMSQYVMHRDARFFEEPERFEPDRWLEEKAIHKYAYFPFGAGPRSCIGASFANMEAALVLATIAQRFRIRLAAGCVAEPLPTVTLRPRHGIEVVLMRR